MEIECHQPEVMCLCMKGHNQNDRSFYGLRVKNTDYSVPLKSIAYNTSIVSGISETELTQTYTNPFDFKFLEVEYYFPISNNVCFTSFKSVYEGKETVGIVKEKEKAKEEYTKHKEMGDTVGYSEILEKTKDIM